MRMVIALFLAVLAQDSALKPASEVKSAFLKLLDRPRVDLDPKISKSEPKDGLVTEHGTIATEKKKSGDVERVPIMIIRPERIDGRAPAVIVLHGTGGSK